MKHVKILKHTNFLNPGEEAGFDDEVADALVKSGHAEIIDFKVPKKNRKDADAAAAAAAAQKAEEDKIAAQLAEEAKQAEEVAAARKAEEERLAAEQAAAAVAKANEANKAK